jgi:hypothetical protein
VSARRVQAAQLAELAAQVDALLLAVDIITETMVGMCKAAGVPHLGTRLEANGTRAAGAGRSPLRVIRGGQS